MDKVTLTSSTLPPLIALLAGLIFSEPAKSDTLLGANLKKRADAVLGLMSFQLSPDVTTGSLSLNNEPTGNPDVLMSTLGGGFTVGKGFPLYLEGTLGYSRYDPIFLASDGQITRPVPTKWNTLSVTGGVGWDFPIIDDLVFRPIVNFSYGRVASDSSVASSYIQRETGDDFEFLKSGNLDVYGLGGALMLDYERYKDEYEIDTELRYTNITLKSFSNAPESVQGSTVAQSLSLWMRWRAPTGFTVLKKPVRYVIEAARTGYIGDMRGALGFDYLNSVGIGLELDSSHYDITVTRTRLILRYQFGDNIEGTSLGFAISF
ncbi:MULTISPECIES: hypothetical protein [Vibrio]|jgi:hypothetical protein|uniref:hypothetical protein n=1 Tax=Vibrio TaxID=662 RepID=UPI000BFF8E12|nr:MULTISPECIES: hypothetical protein [unclassified Vibrio]